MQGASIDLENSWQSHWHADGLQSHMHADGLVSHMHADGLQSHMHADSPKEHACIIVSQQKQRHIADT